MGRVRTALAALLFVALLGAGALSWRSRTRSDVLGVYTPAGHLQALACHRGSFVVFLGELPLGRAEGRAVDHVAIRPGDADAMSETVFDPRATYGSWAGFEMASGTLRVVGQSAGYQAVRVPDWAVVAATGALTLVLARGPLRRRRWAREGRCTGCGYDLRESPDRCPECGHAARTVAPSTVVRRARVAGLLLLIAAFLASSAGLELLARPAAERAARAGPAVGADRPILDEMERTLPETRFEAARLGDVIRFVADATGARLRLDEPGLAQLGVTPDTPVTARLRNVKVSKALTIIVDSLPGRLRWAREDDGVLTLTPRPPPVCLRAYDVGHLIVDVPDFGGSPFRLDQERSRQELSEEIRTLILETVDPDSWKDNGGGGAADAVYVGDYLLILQSGENHVSIENLVRQLDETRENPDEVLRRIGGARAR